MELVVILIFCAALLACVITSTSTVVALLVGLAVFLFYGARKGFGARELAGMAASGVRNVGGILIMMLLVGALTALWRAAGTIPAIVYYTAGAIWPPLFLLVTFLLNGLLSTLTGTSFGTSATMGSMCMAVGVALGVDPMLTGGAVLSGAFVGDRCSPVSTCAYLVATITKTDLYRNISGMVRTAAVPFALACAAYVGLGFLGGPGQGGAADPSSVTDLLAGAFYLGWPVLVPALVVLALAIARVDVRLAMLAGVVAAGVVCVAGQGTSLPDVLAWAWGGYRAASPEVAALLDGGGVVSMLEVVAIVCISSSYAGIFAGTGLIDGIKGFFTRIGGRTTEFFATTVASLAAAVVSCNQTLAVMLTEQLASEAVPDSAKLALYMEDTVVVMAGLVPWSIAGAVPLAACSAPITGMLFGCYLYLLPICGNIRHAWRAARGRS